MELTSAPVMLLYLDPGTGSLLFSLILGLITSAYFVIRTAYERLSSWVLRFFGKRQRTWGEMHPLVLFSEGRQYFSSFKPLLDELARRRIPCTYLSMDPDDPTLQLGGELVDARCIGGGPMAWAVMSHLEASVCLTTTPGVDVLPFKRSKRTAKYIHFVHSPTDKAFNKPYSFDYFDSVLLNGPHQVRTLSHLEQLRGTRRKALPLCGCVYYDYMVAKRDALPASPEKRLNVLVAPTWGRNGLLARFGDRILCLLLEAGFDVTLRPHPQSYISEQPLIEWLRKQLSQYPNLRWDNETDALGAMNRSDVMVSDISGVVFDYAFLFQKPVISVHFEPDKRGTEANDIPYQPWELTVLDTIGKQVDEDDIAAIPAHIKVLLGDEKKRTGIRDLREESVVNFGNAASSVIDEVEKVLVVAREDQAKVSKIAGSDQPATQ